MTHSMTNGNCHNNNCYYQQQILLKSKYEHLLFSLFEEYLFEMSKIVHRMIENLNTYL